MRPIKSLWPALASGLLLIVSFEPFGLWFLAYVALVPLLWAARTASSKRTVVLYVVTGALLACGVYYSTIAYSPWFFLVIIAFFSVSFLLWGLLTRQALARWHGPFFDVMLPALLWTGIEAIATSTIVGVPINLGASQAGQPMLIQAAAWFGVYVVSFLIILTNSAIAYTLAAIKTAPNNGSQGYERHHPCPLPVGEGVFRQTTSDRRRWLPAVVVAVVLAANLAFGYIRLHAPSPAPTIKIAAVQPLISREIYRNGWRLPENRQFMQKTLETLTAQAAASGSEMVFWSEGGNGYMNMRIAGLREKLYRTARANVLDLIVSSEDMDAEGKRFNTVFAISKKGEFAGRYNKARLVPVAEADFTAGQASQPLATSFGKLGVAICFESTFPSLLRRSTVQGAELLFVTSSDAAFRRSALVFAHAQLAVFRAVENGRWLIRAANTGPSLIVSPHGVIVKQSPFYARGILAGEVAILRDQTFFTRWGYLLPDFLAIAVLLLAGYGLFSWLSALRTGEKSARKAVPRNIVASPEQRLRAFLVPLTAIAASWAACAVAAMFMVGASLYLSQRASVSSPGYLAALQDFFVPETPPAERVGERFLQAKKNTCGAAVLAYVFSYLGRDTAEVEVLKQASLTSRGLSMLALKQASLSFGFDAMGVKENYAALQNEVLPAIAYINDSHYVVVDQVTAHDLLLFDPALGHIRVSRPIFERVWNGYLLLIRVRPIPVSLSARNAVAD